MANKSANSDPYATITVTELLSRMPRISMRGGSGSRAKPGVAHPSADVLQCIHAQGRNSRAQAALPRQGQAGLARPDR